MLWRLLSSRPTFGPVSDQRLADLGCVHVSAAFLVTDLTNRALDRRARAVVYAGFALAVVLSIAFATPGLHWRRARPFIAQLIDVGFSTACAVRGWWTAPLVSSTAASAIDTLFFSIAFAGSGLPAVGDFGAKMRRAGNADTIPDADGSRARRV